VILVIVAAGLGGTAHFTGARWYPHGGKTPQQAFPTSPVNRPPTPKIGTTKASQAKIPVWVPIALGVILLAIIAFFIYRWLMRRRLPAPPGLHAAPVQGIRVAPPEPEPEPEALLTGIELALQTLDDERDPADAIVKAWLGLQQTAEDSGIVRRPAETPTEFTARIMNSAFADDRAVKTLLRLYLKTRFGDHPVTAEEVAAVRTALQQLVGNWQAAAQ
jgi:hypothetical protein